MQTLKAFGQMAEELGQPGRDDRFGYELVELRNLLNQKGHKGNKKQRNKNQNKEV